MPTTMHASTSSDRVRSLDTIRPTTAKAALDSDRVGLPSDQAGPRFNKAVEDAVVAHYGSVKAAAYELGDVDPSLMMREFKKGNFRLLEHADDAALGFIAGKVRLAFPDSDPKAHLRRVIRDMRSRLDELAEMVEVS